MWLRDGQPTHRHDPAVVALPAREVSFIIGKRSQSLVYREVFAHRPALGELNEQLSCLVSHIPSGELIAYSRIWGFLEPAFKAKLIMSLCGRGPWRGIGSTSSC